MFELTQGFFRQDHFHDIIECLIAALEAKDLYTCGHSSRVGDMSFDLGRAMGLKGSVLEDLHIAAHLHDIGKMGIPENILNKKGKLLPSEWEQIQKHPMIGYNILSKSRRLQKIAEIVLHHHERWDGRGYPYGLREVKIPLGSRIIAVADSIDEITGSTQYVGNWPGVTIDKKEGRAKKFEGDIRIIDLPGIYSLSPYSMEEIIARDYILDEKPDVVINIVDATNIPYVVDKITTPYGVLVQQNQLTVIRKVLSKSTSDEMAKIMESFVVNGTGKLALIPGIRVGGKSGTAQKIDPVTRSYYPNTFIASFEALAPVDNPKIHYSH